MTVESGDGPPLLLVPGSTFDADALGGLTALLPSFRCHALDRRGRGRSGDAPTYSIELEVADVACVVRRLERPWLFGHSFGALCCLGAVADGAQVERLLLYEPPVPLGGPPDPETLERASSALDAGDARSALLCLLVEIVNVPESEMAFVRMLPDSWFEGFARTALREMTSVVDPDLSRFRSIEQPTLLMLGTESPARIVQATEALEATLPNARVVALDGQGHNAILTAPELVAGHILAFAG